MQNKKWFQDAVLYQIYPQSFADSNADGIGDIRGVIDRLDYIKSLGVDALWFNPCFESPFVDAGYDVSDYLKIAARYGTNADMEELIGKAKQAGIRILLDLVAGHTSIDHPWFQKELHNQGKSAEGDRFVWTEALPKDWDSTLPGTPAWVKSPGPRQGWYLKNFFDEQPALNFGWVNPDPNQPWQDSIDALGPLRNIESLIEIIDFWLSRGVSGFRIDMAFSLIKDYDTNLSQSESAKIWQRIRKWMDKKYPEAILIPEGSEPRQAGDLAFDADFFLVIFKEHSSLFNNQSAGRLPFHEPRSAFFDSAGLGATNIFTDGWQKIKNEDPNRLVVMASADHDFNRLNSGSRTQEQLGAAFTLLMTWGTVPCIWYGDEIGMRYIPDLPNKEGAICNPGYNRAGCRTPMQWDGSLNAGFSVADPEQIYLPIDPSESRPTVAEQDQSKDSTLNLVRSLIQLRKEHPALGTRENVSVVCADYPFIYKRGTSHMVALNPKAESVEIDLPEMENASNLFGRGISIAGSVVSFEPFSFGVFKIEAKN